MNYDTSLGGVRIGDHLEYSKMFENDLALSKQKKSFHKSQVTKRIAQNEEVVRSTKPLIIIFFLDPGLRFALINPIPTMGGGGTFCATF